MYSRWVEETTTDSVHSPSSHKEREAITEGDDDDGLRTVAAIWCLLSCLSNGHLLCTVCEEQEKKSADEFAHRSDEMILESRSLPSWLPFVHDAFERFWRHDENRL